MRLNSAMWTQCMALASTFVLIAAIGSYYEFVPDNEDIFDECPSKEDVIGLYEATLFKDFTRDYHDGYISASGIITCMWEGVEPTDRIEVSAEMYKFVRGDWQPTLLSTLKRNYCDVMFDPNSLSYQVWTRHIIEEDRICLNNYGHVYHHRPFTVNTTMSFGARMEGRHKIVIKMSAYDQNNVKRPKSVCSQIFGEYFKV